MSIVTHQLPSGAHAELRSNAEISERLRRPIRAIQMRLAKDQAFAGVVEKAASKGIEAVKGISEADASLMMSSMGEDSLALMDDLNDRLILARVVRWSFGFEVSADGLLDLPGGDYDELKKLCAEGSLDETDFSPSMAEDSPTAPSTASA